MPSRTQLYEHPTSPSNKDISSLFKPLAPPSDADIILREANENLQKKKTELMQENQKKDETIEKMKKEVENKSCEKVKENKKATTAKK